MKKSLYLIFLLSVLVPAMTGCDQLKIGGNDSPVIAKINKKTITEDDFLREIDRVPEWARAQFTGEEGKDKFLDELIKRELIFQDAKKMRLHKDEEYLAKVEEFEKMTLVSLILKKEVEEKAKVEDAEIRAFFDQNEDKFTVGSQIKASHILVQTEEEAKKIHERIDKGESFAKLAKSLSKDKVSAEKGGDLGYFERGKMVPEFERAALDLKPGEVSRPVKTRFGYHIIKLTDIKKGKQANFEQSKESITRQLLSQKRKVLFDAYVDKLKGKSKISKIEDTIAAIVLPWEQTETEGEKQPQPDKLPAVKEKQAEAE